MSQLRFPWWWQALAVVMLICVVALTLTPHPPRIDLPLLSWDKAQHLIAYAVLMWAFLQAWEGRGVARWALFLVTVGIVLEIMQGLFGVRVMEVRDMIANSTGVLVGYGLWRTPLGSTFARAETRFSTIVAGDRR